MAVTVDRGARSIRNATLDGINARNKAFWAAKAAGKTTADAVSATSVVKPAEPDEKVETKDVAGFEAGGEFHPIRGSKGYKRSAAGEGRKKAKKKKK